MKKNLKTRKASKTSTPLNRASGSEPGSARTLECAVEGGVEGAQSGSGAWMALKEIFLFWGCSLIQKTNNCTTV